MYEEKKEKKKMKVEEHTMIQETGIISKTSWEKPGLFSQSNDTASFNQREESTC